MALTKVCPDCSEDDIRIDARICRHCRHSFVEPDPAELSTPSRMDLLADASDEKGLLGHAGKFAETKQSMDAMRESISPDSTFWYYSLTFCLSAATIATGMTILLLLGGLGWGMWFGATQTDAGGLLGATIGLIMVIIVEFFAIWILFPVCLLIAGVAGFILGFVIDCGRKILA